MYFNSKRFFKGRFVTSDLQLFYPPCLVCYMFFIVYRSVCDVRSADILSLLDTGEYLADKYPLLPRCPFCINVSALKKNIRIYYEDWRSSHYAITHVRHKNILRDFKNAPFYILCLFKMIDLRMCSLSFFILLQNGPQFAMISVCSCCSF